jgi:hypothetical protein
LASLTGVPTIIPSKLFRGSVVTGVAADPPKASSCNNRQTGYSVRSCGVSPNTRRIIALEFLLSALHSKDTFRAQRHTPGPRAQTLHTCRRDWQGHSLGFRATSADLT